MFPHPTSFSFRVLVILLIGMMSGLPACSRAQSDETLRPASDDPMLPTTTKARDLLRQENAVLEEYIIERMRLMNVKMDAGSPGDKTRGRVQEWAKFVVDSAVEFLNNEEPLAGLLDVWALGAQMEKYVREGDGKDHFGVAQVIVRDAVNDVLKVTQEAADAYLSPEAYVTAEANIDAFVAEQPLKYGSSFWSRLWSFRKVPFSLVEAGKDTLMTVASIPLMPSRAGASLRRGAEEFDDFNVTASRFADIAEGMPEEFEEFNVTARRFADIMENLPVRMREEADLLLGSFDDQASTMTQLTGELQKLSLQIDTSLNTVERLSPDIRSTVESADVTAATLGQTAESIEVASAEIRRLVDTLDDFMDKIRSDGSGGGGGDGGAGSAADPEAFTEAAQAIESGSVEVRLLVEQIENLVRPPNPKPRDPDYHRFDIREYTEAANAIRGGSVEVRGILSDITATADDPELKRNSEDLLANIVAANDRIGDRTEVLVRRVLILVAIFFLFIMAVLLAYRVIQTRYLSDRRPQA